MENLTVNDFDSRIEFMQYDSWRLRELDKLDNVLNIPEFQPIVDMCREYLTQRDETKFKKTNNNILREKMKIRWIPMGMVEKFGSNYVTRYDFIEDSAKSKCWVSCVSNYICKSKFNQLKIIS